MKMYSVLEPSGGIIINGHEGCCNLFVCIHLIFDFRQGLFQWVQHLVKNGFFSSNFSILMEFIQKRVKSFLSHSDVNECSKFYTKLLLLKSKLWNQLHFKSLKRLSEQSIFQGELKPMACKVKASLNSTD